MSTRAKLQFGRYDYATFLTFFAYAAGSIVVPVALVEVAYDLNFSLEEGGLAAGGTLHFVRTLAIVFALIVAAFLTGRYGIRSTLGGAVLLMSVGMLLCSLAPAYGVLLLAMMLAGLGEGVIEGLATPFVQELHPEEPGRYINLSHSFWSVGVLVTVLISGVLLTLGVSWRVLVVAVAGLGVLAACLLLLRSSAMQSTPVHASARSTRAISGDAWAVLKHRHFWLYFVAMMLAGGGEFCLTFWTASHLQLHFGSSPWGASMGVAIFALGMVVGRMASGYFIHQDGLRRLIIVCALLGVVICVLLPLAPNTSVFYILLLGAGLTTAPFWPSVQSYAADILVELDSTMLLILLSSAGVMGCGSFTLLMGYLGNFSGSLNTAFYLVPAAYAVLAMLIFFNHRLDRLSPK